MADLRTRDAKLVQYLNEAYGKEKELETALEAHIAMTTRAPYRKRLQEHLKETKRHATTVQRRIKKLGGDAEAVPLPGPDALSKGAELAVELGSRAAVAKGPLHAIRGTGEQEKMLKNAKTEYSEEHEEIATYTAIETLATSLGDRETAQLARAIRREEERMAGFLARLIPTLTKAVVQEEIPAAERAGAGGSRRPRSKRSSSKPAKAGGAKRAKAAAKTAGTKRRASAKPAARRTGAAKKPGAAKARGTKARAAKR
jgi:ferritin-like metal-binding protein YciE